MKDTSQNTPPHAPPLYSSMMYQHHGESSPYCYPEQPLSMYGDRSRVPHSSGKSYDCANVMWPNCKKISLISCSREMENRKMENRKSSGWVVFLLRGFFADFNAHGVLIFVLHVPRVLYVQFVLSCSFFLTRRLFVIFNDSTRALFFFLSNLSVLWLCHQCTSGVQFLLRAGDATTSKNVRAMFF